MVQGGNPQQRPDQLLQALSRAGSGPAPQSQVFIGRLVVVFGTGKGTGIFFYSGTPALGNPPILAITTASSDPYGNPVTASAITDSGMPLLIYSGPPATGNLIISLTPAAGTDAFGNSFPEGLNVTMGVISGSVVNATTITVNPGPFLLYGNQNTTAFIFTSTGTFTPTSNGTVSAGFIGQGAAGTGGGSGAGGGGGEYAQDTDTVTNATPYTITLDATSTRATFNTKTVTAHAGAGITGGNGSTNAVHFNGGNAHAAGFGGGGGAGAGSAGGNSSGFFFQNPGAGGAAAGLFPGGGGGGTAGGATGGNGVAPGGGGGGGTVTGGTQGAGVAVIYFTGTGGSTQLLASMAQGAGTDPVGGGVYNAGVWDYDPTFASASGLAGGGVHFTGAGGNMQIVNTNGYPVAQTLDGNSPDMAVNHVTVYPAQTISAITFASVTGASLPVGANHYRFNCRIFYTTAAAAGTPQFQFTGPAVTGSESVTATWVPLIAAGNSLARGNLSTLTLSAGPTLNGSGGICDWQGDVTFTASGTLQLQALTSNIADTYIIQTVMLDIYPVN